MIDDSGTTIIDVRTPEEYRSGHLKNAMLMPVSEIAGRIGEIDSLKDRPILVYCHAGNRSASASQVNLRALEVLERLDDEVMRRINEVAGQD